MTPDPTTLSAVLAAIAADPTVPTVIRMEAKTVDPDDIHPAEVSRAAVMAALDAHLHARCEQADVGEDEGPKLRAWRDELAAQVRARGGDPEEIVRRAGGERA